MVGGGPGGYVAALRAARLGLRTTLIEKERPGGVCLNWGCIPTKAMLRSAEVIELVRNAADYGVVAAAPELDYRAVLSRKDRIVRQLTDGVAQLLRAAGVEVIDGHARMLGPGALEVVPVGGSPLGPAGPRYFAPPAAGGSATATLRAKNVLLATGSVAAELAVPGAEDPRVVTSDGAFLLEQVPERVVIVGGSAVGVEWATMLAGFGSRVTIVEMAGRLVPAEDEEVSAILERSLVRRGIDVRTSSTVTAFTDRGTAGLDAVLGTASGEAAGTISCDVVITGVGRQPNVIGLEIDRIGLERDARGFVVVDERLATSVEGHFAIGDLTGRAMLAHVASHQGLVAVSGIAGNADAVISYDAVPAVTFCDPEIASVGRTEAQARADGYDVVVGRFPFHASGRAQSYGATEGMVKIVADSRYGEVLGVHIIGPSAADLVAEGVLAMEAEATLEVLAGAIHAHPTFPEVTMEATMMALGMPIHLPAPGRRTDRTGGTR